MDVSLVIPARYGSTRFPGKMLADLDGKPVLKHVWERAKRIGGVAEVLVLTEHEKVLQAVKSWGGECLLTPESCANGTERIAAALDRIHGDPIINLQGDEPFVNGDLVGHMVAIARADRNRSFDILTPIYPIGDGETLHSPNTVKVIRDHGGRAIYFSRHAIPYLRDVPSHQWTEKFSYFGHMGIYLYRRQVLENLPAIPASPLAVAESLEQLRFLQAGYSIATVIGPRPGPAVDVPEDLVRAHGYLLGERG
jgi:3-deoxy-manno-octulosonate cytidylyltransferase (CMP-KDO synthetase)